MGDCSIDESTALIEVPATSSDTANRVRDILLQGDEDLDDEDLDDEDLDEFDDEDLDEFDDEEDLDEDSDNDDSADDY